MNLSPELNAAFNDQITLEFEASTAYRQLSIELDAHDLPGMAMWLRHQADEEIAHAQRFIDHVLHRDGHPVIGAIAAPNRPADGSPLAVFEAALAHEHRVSESIRELYRKADAEGDIDSRPLLNWFVEEQIAEVAMVSEIVARIRMVGDDGPGLLRLDEELGTRPAADA